MKPTLAALMLVILALAAGCGGSAAGRPLAEGGEGTLIAIGGGLDDDNRPVYERFIELARRARPAGADPLQPRIVIAAAASGDQDGSAQGKIESIGAYCPGAVIDVIRRETPADQTIALVDAADAMFFTGGDQKRIVDRYRPNGIDTPECLAMRRLLARGGVIAGTSAGDAMMGLTMFHTGRSAEALGIRSTRASRGPDDDEDEKRPLPPLGPQIGPGMAMLPWAMTDSHFFERHRFGRLVAALELSGHRLGLGVGEDAAVEINLSTGDVTGLSVADTLLVDAGGVQRDGLTRSNIRTRVIRQGMTLSLTDLLNHRPPGSATSPPASIEDIAVVEPGQNRQLASWRFFSRAEALDAPAVRLNLDGYRQIAWSDGRGGAIVRIEPISAE